MKKQILLLLLALPALAYPMAGRFQKLAIPAYRSAQSYMQPTRQRFMSNVPKSTMPLSLQAAALRSQAMPAISTMQTPQRQFGAEVWGPALMGAGAGWFGRSLYNRFNQYWNKPVTPVAPVFVQPSGLQPQEVETEMETQRITASLLPALNPVPEPVKICPIKTMNELFDPQKAIKIAQMKGAYPFVRLVEKAVKNVNEAMPSEKIIIPDRVVEALNLLDLYPELKADVNARLERSIRISEKLRQDAEHEDMLDIEHPWRLSFNQKYWTQEIKEIQAIQNALNR